MPRYLERSEVLEIATKYHDLMLAYDLAELPTANVVEVVRCKNCVIHDICRYRVGLGENGFCSQGRRKETEDEQS